MDTTDADILFDKHGICNHCRSFETKWNERKNAVDQKRVFETIIRRIKRHGKSKQYDCILGLSGGVDSSFLALEAHKAGLRPLVIHVDAGWNTELAVANIQSVIEYCKFDIHTEVVHWEDMRNLHLAYMNAGVANQDVPQDHIFFSTIYHFAAKHNIKYFLTGSNFSTEGIFPNSWHGDAMDAINLKAILRHNGSNRIRSYRTISFFQYYFWYPLVQRIKTVDLLNYMTYNKQDALEELVVELGYRPYGKKHGESFFTKLFQNYILPQKFGFDKRRPHLSSLIMSGQMTRDTAENMLREELYDPAALELDVGYFCKKLGISRHDFDQFMKEESRSHLEFDNWSSRYRAMKNCQRLFGRVFGKKLSLNNL
jgi:aminotransferase